MVARPYDALYRDWNEKRRVPTRPSKWGGFTRRYFTAPRSAADLVAGRDAIAEWARLTDGCSAGRPITKPLLTATLDGDHGFYEPCQENARRWYRLQPR